MANIGLIGTVIGMTLLIIIILSIKEEEWERVKKASKAMIIGVSLMIPFFVKIPSLEGIPAYKTISTGAFVMGILVFVWGVSNLVEKERGKIISFLVGFGVFLFIIFTVVQVIGQYNEKWGVTLANIIPIAVAMYVIIVPLYILYSSKEEKIPKFERSEKEKKKKKKKKKGKEEEKIKSPFRELLKEIEKVLLIFLGILLIRPAFSAATLLLYIDPGLEDYKILTDVNYTINVSKNYLEIHLNFTENITSAKVDIVLVYPDKIIKRSYTIMDGETRVDDLRTQGAARGARSIFSILGLYNFWIPMFLVFLLVYALTAVILPEGTGKDVRALIAFSIAILFSYSSWATSFVTNYVPYIAAGIVVIFGAGIILVILIPEGVEGIKKNPFLYRFLIWVALSVIFFAIGYSINTLTNGALASTLDKEIYPGLSLGSFLLLVWFGILILMMLWPIIRVIFMIGGG